MCTCGGAKRGWEREGEDVRVEFLSEMGVEAACHGWEKISPEKSLFSVSRLILARIRGSVDCAATDDILLYSTRRFQRTFPTFGPSNSTSVVQTSGYLVQAPE